MRCMPILIIIPIALGVILAIRKKKKQVKREKLIDKCLEKYANND